MDRLLALIRNLYIHAVSNSRRILIILSLRIQSFFLRSPLDMKFPRSSNIGRKVKIRLGWKESSKLHLARDVVLGDYVTIDLRGGELILEERTEIRTRCIVKVYGRLHVEGGAGGITGFSYNCAVHCGKSIHVGRYSTVGEFSTLYDGEHKHTLDPDRSFYEAGENVFGPIEIGRNSYIGAKASVMMGVTIGDCSIVGNGSLVNRDVPSYTLVGGVPAKVIKVLKETDE